MSNICRFVLEQRGFSVVVATNFAEIEQQCWRSDIACILVGMDIEPKIKRAIGNLLAETCWQKPLLEICRFTPEIEGASTVHSDAPEDLLAAIDDMLKPSGRRYNEQLYRRAKVIKKKATESIASAREMRARIRQMQTSYRKLDYLREKKPASSPTASPRKGSDDSSGS